MADKPKEERKRIKLHKPKKPIEDHAIELEQAEHAKDGHDLVDEVIENDVQQFLRKAPAVSSYKEPGKGKKKSQYVEDAPEYKEADEDSYCKIRQALSAMYGSGYSVKYGDDGPEQSIITMSRIYAARAADLLGPNEDDPQVKKKKDELSM